MRNPRVAARVAASCQPLGGKKIEPLAEAAPLALPGLARVRQLLAAQKVLLSQLRSRPGSYEVRA